MITRTVEEFVEDLLTLAEKHKCGVKSARGTKVLWQFDVFQTVGELAKCIMTHAGPEDWREVFGTALTAEIDWWEATPYVVLVSVWNEELQEFENPPRVEKEPP